MVVPIVAFHAQPQQDLATLDGLLAHARYAAFDVGARAGVPVLTALSGYLLFASGADRAPWSLYRRKTRTLLVPLLMWNLPLVVALIVLQAMGVGGDKFGAPLWPPDTVRWIDASFGLTRLTINYPLGFLRDLFVLSLLAPLLGIGLRRAAVPTVAACFAVFLMWDGPVIFREQMLPAFAMGGAAAYRRGVLRRLDRRGGIAALTFATGCAAFAWLGIGSAWVQLFALGAVPLLWAAAAVVPAAVIAGAARLSPASFFVFVSHAPIIAISWVVWRALSLPPMGHWIAGPVLTIGLLLAVYAFVLPRLPRALVRVALGGRFAPLSQTATAARHRRG